MNDHQINKRLAEISAGGDPTKREKMLYTFSVGLWNPLHDWGQLGPLVEKYVWDIERHPASDSWSVWVEGFERSVLPGATETDLKRAISLAIIAGHGGKENA